MNFNIYKQITKQRQKTAEMLRLHEEQIHKLINHRLTTIVDKSLPLYLNPLKYIKKNFSDVAEQVAELNVYETKSSAISYCVKTDGAGGLFSMQTHDIFITFDEPEYNELINIEAEKDEILCHEMLHAVSCFRGSVGSLYRFVTNEEDFAYGQMVPYMREKGMTDAEIAKKALMGYCLSRHLAEVDYFKLLGYDRSKMTYPDTCSAWARIKRLQTEELQKGAFKKAMEFIEIFGQKRAKKFNDRFSALEF